MIKRSTELPIETTEHRFGGEGYVTLNSLLKNSEEMHGKGRLFAHITLLPGHSLGYHVHTGESETYYIYSGKGEFDDNGTSTQVSSGDVTFLLPDMVTALKTSVTSLWK